jgi:Fe-S cluster assembly ATP-binding protein
MLKITNLNINVEEITILEDINLEIKEGEVHAIMGPNGAGKSSLANVIAGNPEYTVTGGKMNFKRRILNTLLPEERSRMGIYMTFQDPPEIDGISNLQLMRDILRSRGDKRTSSDIITDYKQLVQKFDLGGDWGKREFNYGASGGEKKKNEIIQMQLLDPSLLILDEIDSGLDIDAVKTISQDIKEFLTKPGKAALIITHQPRILETIKPTHVHIIVDGKIVKSGDRRIIKGIIENVYRKFS